ncbi:MAG: hypothetical protein M3M99_02690 [Actinomycetota bacterium]|nr:hypothetical protein [Actinomycetota bacterium]
MRRQGRNLFALPAVACSLALLTPATALGSAPAVSGHAVSQSPASVRDYWTSERMREAAAIEPPTSESAGTVGAGARASAIAPDLETDPALDTAFPQRLHGRLFMTLNGEDASCSATVVTARSRDLILTAGHCISIPGELSPVGIVWATNVLFVPGYRNNVRPFGSFPATRLGAPLAWLQGGDIGFDLGAVNLAPGAGGSIQEQLGARGVAFNRSSKSYRNDVFEVYGYPGSPAPVYDAQRLIVCLSSFQGFERGTGSPTVAPCHQQEGSSGGGWVRNGQVQSLVSHAGCAIPSIACVFVSGTYFGETAFNLYERSSGGITKGKRKRLKRCKRFNKQAKRLRCRGRVQRFSADPR